MIVGFKDCYCTFKIGYGYGHIILTGLGRNLSAHQLPPNMP
jgi:hypothetical protein